MDLSFAELHTERLLMRRWRDADRDPFAAMNADPEVMRYFPAVIAREESDRSVDRFEQRFDEQGFGWRLARRSWHQGYATEAALAALDVAFNGVGLPRVWSITAVLNVPSERVMQRLGMERVGVFEHPKIEVGHPIRPHVAYRMEEGPEKAL